MLGNLKVIIKFILENCWFFNICIVFSIFESVNFISMISRWWVGGLCDIIYYIVRN